MQYCEHCGAEVPMRSHFCGNCGQLLGEGAKEVSDITRPSQPDLPAQGTPSLFKNPFHSPIDYAQSEQINEGGTIQHDWSQLEVSDQQPGQQFEQPQERNTDENRAVFPDAMLPFAPLGYGQFSAANAPAVQGTPQIGGVPSVPGTPSAGIPPASPGAPPVEGGLASHAAPSMPHPAPSVPQHTWTWEQPQHHVEHAQPTPSHEHPQVHHQPEHTIPTSPLKHDAHHEQQHPQHHYPQHPVKVQHAHRFRLPHVPKAGAATTKLAAGAATKWAIVALTAVVVLAASGVIFVLANAPGLSLSGASIVAAGGTLHVHGKGFVPGGNVAFTLDNGLPVTTTGPHTKSIAGIGAGSGVADASQLFTTTGQAEQLTPATRAVTVGITGTFDADVNVLPTWSPGKHILHATEGLGSRSATLSFTVTANPAHLTVTPSQLDFAVPVGGKVIKSILIGNMGGSQLTWNATTDGSKWLKLTNAVGAVEPNGAQDPLDVMVDATHLKVGDYTASITIHSKGGGDAQIAVRAHISPLGKANQAQVNVNPATLDFGKLSAGQQVFDNITIGNQGTAALKWQADTGGAKWLMLSTTSGTVAAGGLPQTVLVIADSSNSSLKPGLNKATITIKSNGGMATIAVTLTLNSSPTPGGSPTPTVTVTPPPPILSGGPSGFSVPGDPNCTYNSALGWTCTATLSSFSSAQSNLSWTATSSGISGVSFSPPSGTLSPGQTTSVTISIPNTVCPVTATFTFQGPANSLPMAWSCAAPTLSVSTTSINANKDCQFNNGWTCSVSLSLGASDQGQLNWTASSSGISGIAINPANGVLTAGQQPTPVSITVPNTPCPAAVTITFTGQGSNSVPVSWGCSPPQINVSPTTLDQTSSNCTPNSDGTYNCTVTVSETPAGTLSWTATASNGGTINPSNGQLTPSQSSQTVTLMSIPCQSDSFTFQGGNTNATVNWTCMPPQLTVSPTSLDQSTCTLNSDGTYNCTVTVGETSSGVLNWSATSGVGGTINPPNGQLTPSMQQQSVMLQSIPCTKGNFTFMGQGGKPVTVSWSCVSSTGAVAPTSLDPNSSSCSANSDGTYTCTVTVSETPAGVLNWSASSNIGGSINPSSGQLTPSQPQQAVTLASIPCQTGTFTFSFTGSNTVPVSWSCSPKIGVSPTTLNQTSSGCTQNTDGTYTCTVTVSESPAGTLNWSSSSNIGGNITPSSGQLTAGQPQQQVSLASIPCKGGTFTFMEQGNNNNSASVTWTCMPPTITVTLSGNCPGDGNGNSVCTDTLQETGGPGTLNWAATAESDLPGTNLPQNGTLTTGQSVQVKVVIPNSDCPAGGGTAGHYDYTWTGGGSFRVTFTCPASSSPMRIQSSSFVPPFVSLASIVGFAAIARRTRGRKCDKAA